LLDWLEDQPGESSQNRWLASGVDTAGRAWWEMPLGWLGERGRTACWQHDAFFRALYLAIAADVIRPSVPLLIAAVFRRGVLPNVLGQCRDIEGFTRLRALCSADPDISQAGATRIGHRTAIIVAAKGGTIADFTTGDVLDTMGVFGDQAPATLRELRTTGQLTPDELIDRYGLACKPIRDLLVDYLRERQPALDYTSLSHEQRGNQSEEGQSPPQVPHGRPHPRAAARPTDPGP
jgi:hypothetical protein